jgi:hypothetical protein
VSADANVHTEADEPESADGGSSRIRQRLRAPIALVRILRRDPHHVPERLTIFAVDRQAAGARAWAERVRAQSPDTARSLLAEDQQRRTIGTARVDGAIAGTPFFIALVPAYIAFLLQEVRLHLRVAALYGNDPADPRVAGDFLVLRGVRKTVDEAVAELEHVRATPLPAPPEHRTPIRRWYRAVVNVLVLAGFIGAPEESTEEPSFGTKVVDAIKFAAAGLIWVGTWVFPLTFMIVMSWACESDARRFGGRVLEHYRDESDTIAEAVARADRKTGRQRALHVVRGTLVVLSVAVPLVFVAAAIANGKGPLGVNVPDAAAAVVALALVIGVSVAALRG